MSTETTFRGYHAISEVLGRVLPLCRWHLANRPECKTVRLTPMDYDLIVRWPRAAELLGVTVNDGVVKLQLVGGGDFELKRHVGRARYAEALPGLDGK